MKSDPIREELETHTAWPIDRIKDNTLKIGSGLTPSGGSASYLDTGVPLLRSQNIHFDGLRLDDVAFIAEETHDQMSGTKLSPRDVLLNITGASIGRCTYVNDDFGEGNVNQHVSIIRAYGRLHYKYLAHCMSAPWGQDQIFSAFTGASREGLSRRSLGELQVPLPPLPEQKRISAYLDASCAAIDRAVEIKRKQLKTLDTLRKSIIQRAVTQGLNPDVEMKESGVEWLGQTPSHWKVRRIKDIVDARSGNAINSLKIAPEGKFPVFGGNGIRGYTDTFTHEGEFVLIGRQGALCGNINYAKSKFYASEHAVVCSPYQEVQIQWFGSLLDVMNLNQYSNAAAQPGLSVAKIKRLQIPVPPATERIEIAKHISNSYEVIEKIRGNIHSQITTLTAYRKSLIHECVTGKRRISAADVAQVEASASAAAL